MKIRIPEPCHEDWSAMTPAARGRHCAACAKTVVNFTAMTDAEVVAYLRRARGKTCGRVQPTQLDRKLAAPPVLPVGLTQPLRHGIAAATLAVGLAASTSAAAQTAPVDPAPPHVELPVIMGMVAHPLPFPVQVDSVATDTTASAYVEEVEMGEIAPVREREATPEEEEEPSPQEETPMMTGRVHVVRTPIEQVVDTVRRARDHTSPPLH